ncbi:MAG: YggS family pyridoxal phosphate-dependent enzyme [Muribaculaceae bacterium]|nr:YggS family pyridoxal phosphate-dependent enzyme [Muribaculaceae bacterium]
MSSIRENIESLRSKIPAGVELVAVSKFHPVERLREAYYAGQRVFGENRVQELVAKCPLMPADVQWHFIGHLQKNKVRALVPHVSMIESVDSVKLLRRIDSEAQRIGRKIRVLLQLHVAQEPTKSGFLPSELLHAARNGELNGLQWVEICGVMTMATFTYATATIEREFEHAHLVFEHLRATTFAGDDRFACLSMGMSHDWPLAVKHGSNIVRIGSSIFGLREY